MERLEDRLTPAMIHGPWINGHRLIAVEPSLSAGHETVGGADRVYLERATNAVVEETARYFAAVLDVVGFTNDPTAAYDKIVHFSSPVPLPKYAGLAEVGGDEAWVIYVGRSVTAAVVAAHEVGHTFGLEHNDVYGSLMYPVIESLNAAFLPDELATIREVANGR